MTAGFDAIISLTATGQPAGVTVGFSPSTITGVGNFDDDAQRGLVHGLGNYAILVTGTSGGLIRTTPIYLTVIPPASFTVSVAPPACLCRKAFPAPLP